MLLCAQNQNILSYTNIYEIALDISLCSYTSNANSTKCISDSK